MPIRIRIRIKNFFSRLLSPTRIFVLSFAAVILIGGILLLIAGIVVGTWRPLEAGGYRPIPDKSLGPPPPFAAQPSIAPAAKMESPKGAQYCVACGTQLQGDERFCPVCGTTIG